MEMILHAKSSVSCREYPDTAQEHITFLGRVLFENSKRLISTFIPILNLFGQNNLKARGVPEDAANYHLNHVIRP